LNSANYVIKKGRGKPVVIHVDRLRKLPAEIDTSATSGSASGIPATSPPAKRCKSDTAAAAGGMPATPAIAPDTVSVEAANVTNPELSGPVTRAADTGGKHRAARPPRTRSRPAGRISSPRPGAGATVAPPADCRDRPRPPPPRRPARLRKRPARYMQHVQTALTNQACARRETCHPGPSDAAAVTCSVERVCNTCVCADCCFVRACTDNRMPRSRILRREADASDSESDAESVVTVLDAEEGRAPQSPGLALDGTAGTSNPLLPRPLP